MIAIAGALLATSCSAPQVDPEPSPTRVSIPDIPAGTGVIDSTSLLSCTTGTGPVEANGTTRLPEGVTGDIVVSVSWVNSSTSSVYARGLATVASPSEDTEWTVTAALPAGAENVACVVGAVVPG